MFIFGHIGISYGILQILKKYSNRYPIIPEIPTDLPIIAFAAMLPDLIDKPIGEVILADSLANGRIYGHTLLFCILVLMVSLYVYRRNSDTRILIVPVATFLHLMEDRIWMTPQTLFWPLMGWEFPDGYQSAGILDYFLSIFRNAYTPEASYVFLSEILGILIMIIAWIRHHKNARKHT
ncbi:metal-dependent hydrolase [Methanolobus profundi]|uniref:LexA-binding, inner membrane-associated putative hydrolase n=1 Tax=Methanolobus profundi TaxID=487685 RepID=A0A1I4RW47_9EURY|nr:metal-dependent hydrolase [Methanolobus profundi]SFM56485.1 LexA-binding, inner membrane-associated putative hydrolase [Methanolobus profundi]